MRVVLNNVKFKSKWSKLAYKSSLLLLTFLYVCYLRSVGLWYLDSYRELFFFIVSLSIFLCHLVLFATCEKVVSRFELMRLLIKHRDCVFSDTLKADLKITSFFLKTIIYIDIVILIFYIVRCIVIV